MSQIKEKRGSGIGSAMNPLQRTTVLMNMKWICIAWHGKPKDNPTLGWHLYPDIPQTLREAHENINKKIWITTTDQLAVNYLLAVFSFFYRNIRESVDCKLTWFRCLLFIVDKMKYSSNLSMCVHVLSEKGHGTGWWLTTTPLTFYLHWLVDWH